MRRALLALLCMLPTVCASPIDRKALVDRHSPVVKCSSLAECDPLDFMTLGNGDFAVTVDATGLQTLNSTLTTGSLNNPLNIMSGWGWHSTPVAKSRTPAAQPEHFGFENITCYNKSVPYPTGGGPGNKHSDTTSWLRANPHRLNLGRIYFISQSNIADAKGVIQSLDLWTGLLSSNYTLDGQLVQVSAAVHPDQDMLAVQVSSELLLKPGGANKAANSTNASPISPDDEDPPLQIGFDFPYGSEIMNSNGAEWGSRYEAAHTTTMTPSKSGCGVVFVRTLDNSSYEVKLEMQKVKGQCAGIVTKKRSHVYRIQATTAPALTVLVSFAPLATQKGEELATQGTANRHNYHRSRQLTPSFQATVASSAKAWAAFWQSGGAIDLSGSTNPHAHRLESMIVMSQWVSRTQEAGTTPPAETGLTLNSWWGKFHGEMRMWHQAHYIAWGRASIFERSTDYYLQVMHEAEAYAQLQGYTGARWFKMRAVVAAPLGLSRPLGLYTGPSNVGPLLLQEQAHPIVYAELLYRHANSTSSNNNDTSSNSAPAAAGKVLAKYASMVSQTAEFLSSFALQSNNSKGPFNRGCLNVGPPMAPGMGVEMDDPGNRGNWTNTANGCYENTYWLYGLEVAQQWRERQGLPRNREWTAVASTLCRPQQRQWNGSLVYFFDDGSTALVGPATALGQLYACGHLPCLSHGINATVMRNTLAMSTAVFDWDNSYPSDNMVYAMAAARLGQPRVALDIFLRNTSTNIYNPHNGHWQGFYPVLTSTPGGFLYVIAMLAGGWDGDSGQSAKTIFPPSEGWALHVEGLRGLL